MKVIKWLFKYGVLAGYIVLTLVLIVEAALPGKLSAEQSDAVGDIITNITDKEFEKEPEYIHPTGLKISIPKKDKYLVGEVYHLDSVITPEKSSNKSVVWASSDKSIASISNDGTLRLLKKGEVTITGTLKDTEFTDSFTITIEEILLEDFTIKCDSVMDTNHQYTIGVTFIPSNATNRSLKWVSSDPSIATINNSGHVVPKANGIVTFTATSSNGIVKSITVECKLIIIQKIDVTNIEIKDSIITLTEGDKIKPEINVLPSNATTKTLKYVSSNQEVFTVDNKGNITCVKNGYGTLTITSLSNPNVSTQIGIVVNSKEADFKILNEFSNDYALLYPNESIKLNIEKTVMPVEYYFEFISDNNNVCEITEDGVMNGKNVGKCNITIRCTSGDGKVKEITFEVQVKKEVDYTAIQDFRYMIRKGIGHFGAFLVLAVFGAFIAIMFFKRKWIFGIISLILGFGIAGLTEYIQTFVPGRSGLFKDVMIDYAGYLSGTIIVLGVFYIISLIIFIIKRSKNEKISA